MRRTLVLARILLAVVVLAACSDAPQTAAPAGEWLKGDLHLHSSHSTDARDNPVDVVIARAESLGMDYFVFTDHDNHVQGNVTTWSDPAYRTDSMVLLYGIEWTTARAHANLFGAAPWDHPRLYALREGDAAPAIAEAHAQGLHFSVNHPIGGDPWEHPLDLDFDSIEVWNALFVAPSRNVDAIALWEGILAGGRRLSARGGSDSHHQEGIESTILNVGNPTTWIFARERSAEAILASLKAGHVSISYAPGAERVDFTADADGDGTFESIVGDNVAGDGSAIQFRVEIDGFRPGSTYEITVVKDGVTLLASVLDAPVFTFADTTPAGQRAYYRVELRGEVPLAPPTFVGLYGDMIALTNPIYVSFP